MLHISEAPAGVAHLVERHLAKVEVASSSLVFRSKKDSTEVGFFSFFLMETNSIPPPPKSGGQPDF